MNGLETQEYRLGSAGLAGHLKCRETRDGDAHIYCLPPEYVDYYTGDRSGGYLLDTHPSPGLTASYARFMVKESVTYSYQAVPRGIWLCSVERGDLTLIEPGKKARKLKRDIHLLVHRGQKIKLHIGADEPVWWTSVLMTEDFVAEYMHGSWFGESFQLNQAMQWQRQHYNTPDLVVAFEQLKYALRGEARMPHLYYQGKMLEILAIILRNFHYPQNFSAEGIRNRFRAWQEWRGIAPVVAVLDKSFHQPPDIEELANIAQMSATKLRKCFKACCGVSIGEYVHQEKMKQAARLMSHCMTIQEIAAAVGYESPGKFAVAFKKTYGSTPSDFKKSLF